ncbi:hypothetical protein M0657_005171 [Pyricularia oryzae]|nr:hypothetical protein M9X92_007987 [Pyricularia oryzae]KAI7923439.1 hypothetical protein M0657_005171 [Pyricularia oryzae]
MTAWYLPLTPLPEVVSKQPKRVRLAPRPRPFSFAHRSWRDDAPDHKQGPGDEIAAVEPSRAPGGWLWAREWDLAGDHTDTLENGTGHSRPRVQPSKHPSVSQVLERATSTDVKKKEKQGRVRVVPTVSSAEYSTTVIIVCGQKVWPADDRDSYRFASGKRGARLAAPSSPVK